MANVVEKMPAVANAEPEAVDAQDTRYRLHRRFDRLGRLYGDGAVQARIPCLEHLPHSTGADERIESIGTDHPPRAEGTTLPSGCVEVRVHREWAVRAF